MKAARETDALSYIPIYPMFALRGRGGGGGGVAREANLWGYERMHIAFSILSWGREGCISLFRICHRGRRGAHVSDYILSFGRAGFIPLERFCHCAYFLGEGEEGV